MTLQDKNIETRIRQTYPALSKSHKCIADFITENYDAFSFMTAGQVAERLNISESTVVRFAKALGYKGYPALLNDFKESIKNKLTTTERFEWSKSLNTKTTLISQVMTSDVDNIKQTVNQIDANYMAQIVSTIKKSHKIYLLGRRSSRVLAEYFGFYLNFIFDDVHILSLGANDLYDELVNCGENDTLIVFSFPRYANITLQAVDFAQKRGMTVIGITDNDSAPISIYADYMLMASCNMTTFIDSLVAPMSLINALIMALASDERDKLSQTFDILENVWDENDVYSTI